MNTKDLIEQVLNEDASDAQSLQKQIDEIITLLQEATHAWSALKEAVKHASPAITASGKFDHSNPALGFMQNVTSRFAKARISAVYLKGTPQEAAKWLDKLLAALR